jgi:MFS family permease
MILKAFKRLFPLFIVQFFTWFALFALWIYATPVITKYFFKTTDSDSMAFENGTQWVSVCFALYATLAAFLNFLIPRVLQYISKQRLHAIGLLVGSMGLLLIYFFRNKWSLMISFSFIGIAWSSIGNIPYRMVGELEEEEPAVLIYFAVFNFSVVLPQIIASYVLGYANKNLFHNETIHIMLAGSVSMFLAAVLMFFLFPGGKKLQYKE